MEILVTVIIVLMLSTNTLVVADDQCTQYQFDAPFYPGSSCEDIYNMNPQSRDKSGYYWIFHDNDVPTNVFCGMNYTGLTCVDIYNNNPETGRKNGYYPINNTQWTFCNMTAIAADITDSRIILSCAGVEGEWRRIASINISAGDDCPTGWSKSNGWNEVAYDCVSFCRAPSDDAGCYSTKFSTNGVSYHSICGQVRGYQKGTTYGFSYHRDLYVDGISITHGNNPRQHIWTYAVGVSDIQIPNSPRGSCPCAAAPGIPSPSFVGSNYYCESGALNSYEYDIYYFSDPLWDGAGFPAGNTCCDNTTQPWFYYQSSGITQDDIEVRICSYLGFSRMATLVDILELYIQ